jgi:hypothetical protein
MISNGGQQTDASTLRMEVLAALGAHGAASRAATLVNDMRVLLEKYTHYFEKDVEGTSVQQLLDTVEFWTHNVGQDEAWRCVSDAVKNVRKVLLTGEGTCVRGPMAPIGSLSRPAAIPSPKGVDSDVLQQRIANIVMTAKALGISLQSAGLGQDSTGIMAAVQRLTTAVQDRAQGMLQEADHVRVAVTRAGEKAPEGRCKQLLDLIQMLLHVDEFQTPGHDSEQGSGMYAQDSRESYEQHMRATHKGVMQMLPSMSRANVVALIEQLVEFLEARNDMVGCNGATELLSWVDDRVSQSEESLKICVRKVLGKKWSTHLQDVRDKVIRGDLAVPACRCEHLPCLCGVLCVCVCGVCMYIDIFMYKQGLYSSQKQDIVLSVRRLTMYTCTTSIIHMPAILFCTLFSMKHNYKDDIRGLVSITVR